MRTSKADAYARRILGSDLSRRFTPEENREHLRLALGDRGVSAEIIDRIIRLNPVLVEGQLLRGWHQKRFYDPRVWRHEYVGKGEFLRQFGREAFDRVRKRDILKRGRRVFVNRAAVMEVA